MDQQKTNQFYQSSRKEDLILRDILAIDRTILANERTLLAYLRAAFTLMIAGITFVRFFGYWFIEILGWISIGGGLILAVIGLKRYKKIKSELKDLKSYQNKEESN